MVKVNVMFRKKVWTALTSLKFPKGVIRNVLIERGNKRIITHISMLKIIGNFRTLERY